MLGSRDQDHITHSLLGRLCTPGREPPPIAPSQFGTAEIAKPTEHSTHPDDHHHQTPRRSTQLFTALPVQSTTSSVQGPVRQSFNQYLMKLIGQLNWSACPLARPTCRRNAKGQAILSTMEQRERERKGGRPRRSTASPARSSPVLDNTANF